MYTIYYILIYIYIYIYIFKVSGHPESRYITLLIYLNDMLDESAGGETSFPKAKAKLFDGSEREGIKVHPGKGSAVNPFIPSTDFAIQ